MRVSAEPSYVLHARAYRESSSLVEALTRQHGRIGLVARGARGAKSRWKNMLQPFRPLLLSWNQRGELGTLTGAEQIAAPPALAGEALFCGLYANELLMRFLQRSDAHAGLFDQYKQLVSTLAGGARPQPLLRRFEFELLNAAGFGLQLDCEARSGEPLRSDAWYDYRPEHGPVMVGEGAEPLENMISGEALLALKSGDIDDRHLAQLKLLMRRLIRFHLGERAIKSQQLFT